MDHRQPGIGLVLGAGGIRACAHIGVLKVLTSEQIPISFVAGASAGALIGAGFAGGMTPDDIENAFLRLELRDYLRFYLDRIKVKRSSGVGRTILDLSGSIRMDELPIPCAVVALDLYRRERVVLREGPARDAMMASIAIPFISGPVRLGGRRLYDGGLIDPVPVDLPRTAGVDRVLAVDVTGSGKGLRLQRLGRFLSPALREFGNLLFLMSGNSPRYSRVDADLRLCPDLRGIGPNSIRKSNIRLAITRGEACARASLPAIRRLVQGTDTKPEPSAGCGCSATVTA